MRLSFEIPGRFHENTLRQPTFDAEATNGYGSAPQKLINRYKTDDIEIALTKLDADFASANSRNQRKRIQGLRQCLERDLVRYFLNYRASEKLLETTPWLKKLLDKGIHRGDIAVSLNYDCVFEGALDCRGKWSPNGGYGLVFTGNPLISNNEIPKSAVTVLKIHGSTSFRFAPYADRPSSVAINIAVNEDLFPKSGKNRHFDFGLGRSATYLIAPSYVNAPKVEIVYLMLDALKAAAKAKNLIIIGCSMRSEDAFLTIVLTQFFRQPSWRQKRVIVVDPHARRITSKIQRYWGVKISKVAISGFVQNSVDRLLKRIGP
ncbi:MAG: hypothetical protein Q8S00_24410 [Deltaproteobacteria bacterium]|nr:hypothetical protein [Deltaproteobacteria bacterium]